MSSLRGPSAEDHLHYTSPATNDNKAMAASTTSIPSIDDLVATRKCCTLCNLLVCLDSFVPLQKNYCHTFELLSFLVGV